MSRVVVGLIVAAAGAVLVVVAAAADLIGISSGGSAEMFGRRQIIGTTVGAATVVAGLTAAFVPRRPSAKSPTRSPAAKRSHGRPAAGNRKRRR